jgi:hypothetical protein
MKNSLEYYITKKQPINLTPNFEDENNVEDKSMVSTQNRLTKIPSEQNILQFDNTNNSNISDILTRSKSRRLSQQNLQSNIDDKFGGEPPYKYRQQYDSRFITKKPEERDTSKIAYGITIDMELHPGKSLTPEQLNESKCNSRYNAIRKAFSEFTGRPYVIPPVYKTSQTKKKIGGNHNKITRRNC